MQLSDLCILLMTSYIVLYIGSLENKMTFVFTVIITMALFLFSYFYFFISEQAELREGLLKIWPLVA